MKAPIFYYHSVGGPPPQTLALPQFQQHLEAIRRHNYRTVTVAELLQAGRDLPSRCVALAFDDGLLDNYTHVFPLLLQYGMRATFYVVPGYDRVTRWVAPQTGRWSDLPAPGFTIPFASMGTDQRRELARHGCPVGTLCSELRKLGGSAADRSTLLFSTALEWMERQFRALGKGADSRLLAVHLLSATQGVSVLAHTFSDPGLIDMEAMRLKDWIRSL